MVVVWIARVVAVVLFAIVMTLWATAAHWLVGSLSKEWTYFGAGIPAGMAIALFVEWLDKKIRQRNRNLGD